VKVLTHRPRYIEPVVVPKFGAGSSSAAKTIQTASTAHSAKEPDVMPKVLTAKLVETKVDKAEEPKIEEITKMPEILSPPTEATVPKVQMGSAVTPKRRKMENVLDVVLETTKTLSPAPTRKVVEASKAQPEADSKQAESKLQQFRLKPKLGLQCPPRWSMLTLRKNQQRGLQLKKSQLLVSKHQTKVLTTLFVMLRER
jgi:hypothetical protein